MIRSLPMVVVLALSTHVAQATNIWLSTESPSSIGEVPTVVRAPGSFELNLWVRPDEGRTLANFGLNLRSTNPDVVRFEDATVYNPYLGNHTVPGNPDVFRFEFVNEGALAISNHGQSIVNLQGFSVTGDDALGAGIGPQTLDLDPGYEATTHAWLLGTIHGVGRCCGDAELFLEIGQNGIGNAGERTSETFVVFGAVDDTPLNGETDRQRPSDTTDATFRFVPEATSFVLMLIGGLSLLLLASSTGSAR